VALFGWIRKDNGLRRYKKAYIETAKKSGKSEFMAAIENFMLVFDNEDGAQVYTCATKRPQADHVFKPASIMMRRLRNESKKIKSIIRVMTNEIQNKASNGFIKTLTADAATEDGMDVHCGVADEYHAHKTDAILANMESGTVGRLQALIIIITTAGFNPYGPCGMYRKIIVKILKGVVEQETTFAIIYTLDEGDDWEDVKTWYKANPAMPLFPNIDNLMHQYKDAKIKGGQSIVNFKTKSLNIWVDSAKQWIDSKKWAACGGDWQISDHRYRKCYIGVDLSSRRDLTAISLLFVHTDEERIVYDEIQDAMKVALDKKDKRKYNKLKNTLPPLFWSYTQLYCPEEKIVETEWSDGVDYRKWTEEGYITATPGNIIDYAYLEQDLIHICDTYDVQLIGYDPWNADKIIPSLIDRDMPCEPFRQGYKSMSPACLRMEMMIYGKMISHDKNPVIAWNISNCVTTSDPAGNIKIDKSKCSDKVDGAVAMAVAIGSYIEHSKEVAAETSIPLLEDEKPLYDDY
jgi:phage terminase large subunit-like protein